MATLDQELLKQIGPSLSSLPQATIEARILAALTRVTKQRVEHVRIDEQVRAIETKVELLNKDLEAKGKERDLHVSTAMQTDHRLTQLRAEFDRLRQQIDAATADLDPKAERERVNGEIIRLETALTKASEEEAKAARLHAELDGMVEQLRRGLADACLEAEKACRAAEEALHQAGFADAAAVRAAALSRETIQQLQNEVSGHHQAVHALQSRVTELLTELGDRRVSQEVLQTYRQAAEQSSQVHRPSAARPDRDRGAAPQSGRQARAGPDTAPGTGGASEAVHHLPSPGRRPAERPFPGLPAGRDPGGAGPRSVAHSSLD